MKQRVAIFNQTRQSFLGLDVTVADTHLGRLIGLLGTKKLRGDGGVWLVPSQGIHTIGMLFPIDVVYLNAEQRVTHLIEHLGSFRIAPVRMNCQSVLELPLHTIDRSQTEVGDELLIWSAAEMEIHWKAQQARRLAADAPVGGTPWKTVGV